MQNVVYDMYGRLEVRGAGAAATWRTTTSGAGVRQCNRRNYNTDSGLQRHIAYCLASPTLGIER